MPIPKAADIKIPELPGLEALTTVPDPGAGAFVGRLQMGGVWYELYPFNGGRPQRDDRINAEVQATAQQLVYVKITELDQYRQQLDRTRHTLEQAQAAMQQTAEPPFPNQACAQAGLQIWKQAQGQYMLEKPLTYYPQHIVRHGNRHQILPGQYKPRMVMAQVLWTYPGGGLMNFRLLDMTTGQTFVHYHTIVHGGGDCTGALGKYAKDYPELLRMFAMWEQQLQTITVEGTGEPPLRQPSGMPHIDAVKIVEQVIKDGGAWTTPQTSPAPSS